MGQILGCVRVKESNVGIKEVFEKFDEVLQPGCHYVPWYLGRRVAATHSLGFKHFYVATQAKTKDNVLVTLNTGIQYRVLEEMVVEAHYKAGNPETHMSLYVSNAIMPLVAKMDLDSLYQDKNEIATAVQKEIGKAMSAIGFEILQTFIYAIRLDESVKKAMNDAVKFRLKTEEKAEAGKRLHLKMAETAAESKYLVGLGMARQFQAIADGVSESKLAFSESEPNATATTSSKDIMEMVLVNHYFDTMKEITASAKTNAVFNGNAAVSQMKDGLANVQGNVAAAKDAVSQVKKNAPIQGNAAAKGAASLVRNAPIPNKGNTPTNA